MPVTPLPTPHFRGSGYQFAAQADFSDASPATPNYTTGKWVLGTLSNVDTSQLDPLATTIEKLIQQDFAANSEDDGTRTVTAAGGSPASPVARVQTAAGDAPDTITVGAQAAWPYAKAASLAALIRSLGYGTVWTPPA